MLIKKLFEVEKTVEMYPGQILLGEKLLGLILPVQMWPGKLSLVTC